MQDRPERNFPLSHYFHYDNFKHYYAFGNSLAEDFLQSVSPKECRRPTILSLGCGDMRSVMFTIFKNFGLDGVNSNGFKDVNFVLNDRSAAVLARNILFLHLCMNMPDDGEVWQKEWIASVWSLWYNHELLPQHDALLYAVIQQLIKWSSTWQEWSTCPLGAIVHFSSPATFEKIKEVWRHWNCPCLPKSVEEMRKARSDFQSHHMVRTGKCSEFEARLKKSAHEDFFVMINSLYLPYPQETFTIMENENLCFLREGTVWAECVLDMPMPDDKTAVNHTLFEREDGMYTLQYALTPYVNFPISYQHTHAEVGRTLGKEDPLLKLLPVADTHFKTKPLLANSVQQFALWLKATSSLMKKTSGGKLKLSILFDLDDALTLCCFMLHHPEMYDKFGVRFDAIYTSNLLDHISPPALVFSCLPLLKPGGILFTSTFKTLVSTNRKYLEEVFGFSPELFPVFLGIHCVGHDGDCSSAVNPTPYPRVNLSVSSRTCFPWKYIESQPLTLEESPHAIKSLIELCDKYCNYGISNRGSADSFLCVLKQVLKQFKSLPLPSHQFVNLLCSEIQTTPGLKSHLVQLQTQSLLHGMHLHVILTESDCPICRDQPLESYIQQFTLSFDTCVKMAKYEAPSFMMYLFKYSGEFSVVTSIAVDISGSKVELVFFLPKYFISQYDGVGVNIVQPPNTECIFQGTMNCLKTSSVKFLFLEEPVQQRNNSEVHGLGDAVKHIGDGYTFETVISMNKTCWTMDTSQLIAKCFERNKLMLSYGEFVSNIVYPYPINESKVHVKVSKKNRIISVVVQRDRSVFYEEKPIYYIDPSNKLSLPRFCNGMDTIETYYNLQALFGSQDHPLFNAKRSFIELFKHAFGGQKYFTLSFPSKRFRDSPDVYALVNVHDLRFSPVFNSPALDVSYCFLDTTPPHLIHEFRVMYNCLGIKLNIIVDDAEYKFLKGVFNFFSTVTQCALSIEGHSVTLPVQTHKLWQYFDQAILFPLYPNPENQTYQKYNRFAERVCSEHLPADVSPSHEQLSKLCEGNMNACSYCNRSSESLSLKNCGRCLKTKYCSKECQRSHWMLHKLVCRTPEQKKRGTEKEVSESPKQQDKVYLTNQSQDTVNAATSCNRTKCSRCKNPATVMCSCESVSYCSKACQALEWPQHQEKCKLEQVSSAQHSSKRRDPTTGPNVSADHHSSKRESTTCATPASSARLSTDYDDSKGKSTVLAIRKCSNCGKTKPSLKYCKCRDVLYCSAECQRLHWPQHKPTCTAVNK